VAQLHSILSEQKEASKGDAEIARQISGLELTERLSPYRLNQFRAEFQPEPKTLLALTLLSDISAFLDPPSDDLLILSPPDPSARKTMLEAAVKYVINNIQRLPNFLATKTTRSFDDSPPVQFDFGTQPLRGGLHFVNAVNQEITFRNGREQLADATSAQGSQLSSASVLRGLTSWGEFGTLQAIILADSAKGELNWSHWERGDLGDEAVFDFTVSEAASHYSVDYCCVRNVDGPDLDHPYIRRGDSLNQYKGKPAYHGSLSIDPRTGAILRITLRPEFRKSDPISRNDVAVQFDEVKIGSQSFICPIQSVAISSTLVGSEISSAVWQVLRVNDSSFSKYRKFGSTAKILPGFSEPK
jgi:hypothetical protein